MADHDRWVLSAGRTVDGRYELLGEVGRGPVGVVYRARDLALGLDVAFKQIHPALSTEDTREANLSRLNRARAMVHERLVAVTDVLSRDSRIFVISPYLDAPTLRAFLEARHAERRPITRLELATLSVELCRALAHVHELAPHGNLKPENIFVIAGGVRLGDPYRLLGRTEVPAAHGSFPLGEHYLAPECLRVSGDELVANDLFALAMIAGEILVGAPVRPGCSLSEQGPLLSAELDQFFLRATDPDPSARYPSLEAFWEALKGVLGFPALRLEDSAVAGELVLPAALRVGGASIAGDDPPTRRMSRLPDPDDCDEALANLAAAGDDPPTRRMSRLPEFKDGGPGLDMGEDDLEAASARVTPPARTPDGVELDVPEEDPLDAFLTTVGSGPEEGSRKDEDDDALGLIVFDEEPGDRAPASRRSAQHGTEEVSSPQSPARARAGGAPRGSAPPATVVAPDEIVFPNGGRSRLKWVMLVSLVLVGLAVALWFVTDSRDHTERAEDPASTAEPEEGPVDTGAADPPAPESPVTPPPSEARQEFDSGEEPPPSD